MKISIAMATFNGENYILEQLQSIYNQSCPPYEIVIVDDCSTDLTVSIIKEFIEENSIDNIRLFQNEKNIGVVANFKRAILETKGDIIFLSDQDDIWNENKIEVLSNILRDHQSVVMATHAYQLIDKNNKLLSTKIHPMNKSTLIKPGKIIKKNLFPGWTYAFKKNELIHFISNINEDIYIHDWYLALVSSISSKLYFTNNILGKYRIHDSNVIGVKQKTRCSNSYKKRKDTIKNRLKLLLIIESIFENNKFNKKSKSKVNSSINFYRDRIKYLEQKSILKFSLYLIKSFYKYDSLASLLGDIVMFYHTRSGSYEKN